MDKARRNAAIDFYNQAVGVGKQDPQLAYRLLCSAVTVDPEMGQGWYLLGNSLADLKHYPASIAAFQRALTLPDGDYPGDMTADFRAKTLVNLGHRLLNDGRIEDAAGVTAVALRFLESNPDLDQEGRAFCWTNMSLILTIKGDLEGSLRNAKIAFEKSQKAIIETGLGFAYLFSGDFEKGLKHFEARFEYKGLMKDYPYRRWDGGRDEVLFIVPDQGLGDTLSFARFVPEVSRRVGRVIFSVQPELVRLLGCGLKHLGNVEVVPTSPQFPAADVWCPVVSLPVALGLSSEEIEGCVQGWEAGEFSSSVPVGWKAPGACLHVGIAYGGSAANEIDRWRSIPVEQFLDLYGVPGVQLYSLQVGERVADLHMAGAAGLIKDMSPWIRDAADTVAIMRELDLVITIESFVGHLAGAIGKECWVPLSWRGGDYRCGKFGDRPIWYGNTLLFREGAVGGWGPVFGRLRGALAERSWRAGGSR